MSQLLVAALTFLLSVGSLLGVAAWNRAESHTVVVTERELPVVITRSSARGAPEAVALQFRVQQRSAPDEARLWLPDATLRQLGFSLGVPAGAPEAGQFYLRSLPRQSWVAFEMDGDAFVPIARQLSLGGSAAVRSGASEGLAPSRLVPVDAGRSRDLLQARWRDRPVLLLPAVIAMRYEQHPTRGPSVWAQMTGLSQATLQVPQRVRQAMARAGWLGSLAGVPSEGTADQGMRPPRYDVVLGVGRLGAVWVEDVRPHQPRPSAAGF